MAKFSVIIPAAGKGERFSGGEKKTFAKLDGKPIFILTVSQFVNRDDVCNDDNHAATGASGISGGIRVSGRVPSGTTAATAKKDLIQGGITVCATASASAAGVGRST